MTHRESHLLSCSCRFQQDSIAITCLALCAGGATMRGTSEAAEFQRCRTQQLAGKQSATIPVPCFEALAHCFVGKVSSSSENATCVLSLTSISLNYGSVNVLRHTCAAGSVEHIASCAPVLPCQAMIVSASLEEGIRVAAAEQLTQLFQLTADPPLLMRSLESQFMSQVGSHTHRTLPHAFADT
eukprot:2104300-Pleurochrysis_carterae.AAC.6